MQLRTLLLVAAACFAASGTLPGQRASGQKAEDKPSGKPAAPRSGRSAPTEPQIPADAKEIDQGIHRWVDKDGKAWIFQRTPFGLMKRLETESVVNKVEIPAGMKAEDRGDKIFFTRPSAFGNFTWERRKTDLLTDIEQAAWDRDKPKKDEPAPDPKTDPKSERKP